MLVTDVTWEISALIASACNGCDMQHEKFSRSSRIKKDVKKQIFLSIPEI